MVPHDAIVKGRDIRYGPVRLVKGKLLAIVDCGRRIRFEIRAGRWHNSATCVIRDVAVLVQIRIDLDGRASSSFCVVLEPDEVPGVVEGLNRWAEMESGGLVGACFQDGASERETDY